MKRDEHGDRMKYYEQIETSKRLMKGLPIYARLDGRSFSKFTKVFEYPYDEKLRQVFDEVCKHLIKEFNCCLAFHQSDEISLLIASESEYGINVDSIIFDGKIQKLCSLLASACTAKFITSALEHMPEHTEHILKNVPTFDCRVFNVPSMSEAIAQFVWREKDATKNSVSMLARAHFSHKELHNKNSGEMIQMLESKGVVWADMPFAFKRGSYLKKKKVMRNGIERNIIEVFEVPPITKISNNIGVLLYNEEPIFKTEV